MAQAHETGTSQDGGIKLAKVFYDRIFFNSCCKYVLVFIFTANWVL